MAFYAKVRTLPDGGQELTIWEGVLQEADIDQSLGTPSHVVLLSLGQVVNSRDAVGTFVSVPGGLDLAED
jgi:hypothetical protein